METALILVDIQNDYFPGGRMELVGFEEASSKARDCVRPMTAAFAAEYADSKGEPVLPDFDEKLMIFP